MCYASGIGIADIAIQIQAHLFLLDDFSFYLLRQRDGRVWSWTQPRQLHHQLCGADIRSVYRAVHLFVLGFKTNSNVPSVDARPSLCRGKV